MTRKKTDMPPPKLPLKLLKWFCKPDYHLDIEGDLLELYDHRKKTLGDKKAKFLLIKDVLLLFRPGIVRSFTTSQKLNHIAMLRHNFILTFRSFKRYKTSFLINIIGLSTGLASALLIYLWINDELNVDKFHDKDGQIYQIMQNFDTPNGIVTRNYTPAHLAKALLKEIPEVEFATSTNTVYQSNWAKGIVSSEGIFMDAKGILADEDYFSVFSYNLIRGNKDLVLEDKNSIVISERLAKKLFKPTENIIGKTLEWKNENLRSIFQVSGIFENTPLNSTVQFDFIINYNVLLDNNSESRDWNSDHAYTYLVLKEGTDTERFNEKIAGFLGSKHPQREKCSLFVQQYSKRYLYGKYENGVPVGGRIMYVRLFFAIALFILLIACINFMNLSTAQASRKMKAIGIKKAIGINRGALIIQFLGESTLMAILSLAVALLIVVLLLPQFNIITEKHLHLNPDIPDTLSIVGIVLVTGIISGIYPAFYLSGFNPATVLKGKFGTAFNELLVRRVLVIFQLTLSAVFIVGFLVIYKQIELTQTKNLGYDQDNVITFQRQGEIDVNGFEVFLSELKNTPGVVNASTIAGNIMKQINLNAGYSWQGSTPEDGEIVFPSPEVNYNFIETLGIELKEGRSFSHEYSNEFSKLVINEAAAKMIGFKDPIGKYVKRNQREMQIIGVVKNFHYTSLHESIRPVFFRYGPNGRTVMVKIKNGAEETTIENLKEIYEKFHPNYPFEFTFLDEDYQMLYDSENKVSALSKYFAGLAILISCLGLFGLASFTTERRIKEIGIRKIMGSNAFDIVRLLTGNFTKTIIISIVISLPASYLLAKNWLDSFAYRIDLEWWYFAGAGILVLFIAWITVGLQTIKAARVNPVNCLKDE
ncbi:ABC transporter permease [Fulvivirgaceae bacterium BMA12]|uniref:ABC transporter permease n=1 Tax=Agaribacillus aureus TaxID=3051825 RepID=A0ABT8LJM5_9BACT|nr:ABC transporter permease [Fulvivirgaceae bacterium BMA12]